MTHLELIGLISSSTFLHACNPDTFITYNTEPLYE